MTVAQANADVARLVPVLMESGQTDQAATDESMNLENHARGRPLKQQVVGNVSDVLWVVMTTIGLVADRLRERHQLVAGR